MICKIMEGIMTSVDMQEWDTVMEWVMDTEDTEHGVMDTCLHGLLTTCMVYGPILGCMVMATATVDGEVMEDTTII